MATKTNAVVVLPDWQVPLHDEQKIKRVADFIGDFQPIRVGHVGDMTDSTQLGRWARGLREEFDGGLETGFEKTRELLAYHRLKYDGPFDLVRSNHDERLENAIEQRLPGLKGLTINGHKLNIQNALRLDDFGIAWHESPFEIAPNWVMAHGDEGRTSSTPGATALLLAGEIHKNVVSGHTHRAGLAWSSKGLGDDRQAFAGMEVGHAMTISAAEYLGRARLNNWGTAFGILWMNDVTVEVFPQLVSINPDEHFMVNGERY
jgi:predicted phosphodiesterase